MVKRSAVASVAATYAHLVRVKRTFATPDRDTEEIPPLLRVAARETLPVLLSVAEFDSAPPMEVAIVESLYADVGEDEARRPAWQRMFVRIVRQVVLSLGRVRGVGYSAGRLVDQVRGMIGVLMPDAPRAVVELDHQARSTIEEWAADWPERLPWGDSAGWDSGVERRARELAHVWAEACGVRWAYESDVTRRSVASEVKDDLKSPAPRRREIQRLPRRKASRTRRLVGDVAALLMPAAPSEVFSTANLGALGSETCEPSSEEDSRVAAAVAEELKRLALQRIREPHVVGDGLRMIARRAVESLLLVGWYDRVRSLDVTHAITVCDRRLSIESRGMLHWQYSLVWLIQQHVPQIDALLHEKDVVAVDARLRSLTEHLRDEMPPVFGLNEPALGTLEVRLTSGRGTRVALSPHGLAKRWCGAYGAEFPPYPSSQRPARAAARLRGSFPA